MASEAVKRLYAKLDELGLQIGGITLPPGTREITSDQVADNIYESICALERGEYEEVGAVNPDDKLHAYKEKFSHLDKMK